MVVVLVPMLMTTTLYKEEEGMFNRVDSKFVCGMCDQRFNKRKDLLEHIVDKHPDIYRVIPDVECANCHGTLKLHEVPGSPGQCPLCGATTVFRTVEKAPRRGE